MNSKLISIIIAVLFCTANTNAQRYFTKLMSQNDFGSPYSASQGKSVFDGQGMNKNNNTQLKNSDEKFLNLRTLKNVKIKKQKIKKYNSYYIIA